MTSPQARPTIPSPPARPNAELAIRPRRRPALTPHRLFISSLPPLGLLLCTLLAACESAAPPTSYIEADPADAAPQAGYAETDPVADDSESIQTAVVEPAPFGPIHYYQQNCASCHGDYGGDFLHAAPGDFRQLRHAIDVMAANMAGDPLDDIELDIQTAYHLSLSDDRPFLAVTAIDPGAGAITGEVTPGATVELIADGATYPAEVDGHDWTARLPPDIDPAAITVHARRANATTTLPLATTTYSHQPQQDDPPPATNDRQRPSPPEEEASMDYTDLLGVRPFDWPDVFE